MSPGKPTAFGRKVLLDETEGGNVSHDAILADVGLEHPHLIASRDAHQQRCGRAPDLVAGDRGLYPPENEDRARERGVRRVAVLPKAGRASQERQRHERQRWFRRGCRFRAGMEGQIHVLKRDAGLDRCRDHGEDGFGRWVGWGIVAHNRTQMARAQATTTGRAARARSGRRRNLPSGPSAGGRIKTSHLDRWREKTSDYSALTP